MNEQMFEELFGGKTRYRALRCLFENQSYAFGLRELAEKAQMNPGNLNRLIKRWVKTGLVTATYDRGNRYRAADDPTLTSLIGLFHHNSELVKALSDLFANTPEVEKAFIFGSFARGESTASSDIDILAIGQISELKLNARLKPIERQFARPINATVYDRQAFEQQLHARDPVITRINEEAKITLKELTAWH